VHPPYVFPNFGEVYSTWEKCQPVFAPQDQYAVTDTKWLWDLHNGNQSRLALEAALDATADTAGSGTPSLGTPVLGMPAIPQTPAPGGSAASIYDGHDGKILEHVMSKWQLNEVQQNGFSTFR
jgi:hypothetical protein